MNVQLVSTSFILLLIASCPPPSIFVLLSLSLGLYPQAHSFCSLTCPIWTHLFVAFPWFACLGALYSFLSQSWNRGLPPYPGGGGGSEARGQTPWCPFSPATLNGPSPLKTSLPCFSLVLCNLHLFLMVINTIFLADILATFITVKRISTLWFSTIPTPFIIAGKTVFDFFVSNPRLNGPVRHF